MCLRCQYSWDVVIMRDEEASYMNGSSGYVDDGSMT